MPDWWTGFQLDHAVSWAGRHIESKLQETQMVGDKLQHVYTLEEILGDVDDNEGLETLFAMFNGRVIP